MLQFILNTGITLAYTIPVINSRGKYDYAPNLTAQLSKVPQVTNWDLTWFQTIFS